MIFKEVVEFLKASFFRRNSKQKFHLKIAQEINIRYNDIKRMYYDTKCFYFSLFSKTIRWFKVSPPTTDVTDDPFFRNLVRTVFRINPFLVCTRTPSN